MSNALQHVTILLKGLPRETFHYGRGRPRREWQSKADMTRLFYLISVSKKYKLDTHEFLMCFRQAWAHERSSQNSISIQLRQRVENSGVFLVTQDEKVIAQLHLSQNMLEHLPEVNLVNLPFIEFAPSAKKRGLETTDVQIKDIDARVKWVNLIAKVVGKSNTRNVFSRFGESLALSIATISDGSGSVRLPLWNAQIDRVLVGDTVQIENGRVRLFRGELQVSVGRNGKLGVTRTSQLSTAAV